MRNPPPISNPQFTGPISSQLDGFLKEKRDLGYRYQSEAWRLAEIDRLSTAMKTPESSLPRSLVEEWNKRTPTESTKTWRSRMTVMNQLADYFFARNLEMFKPSLQINAVDAATPFAPHIFTGVELRGIFAASDEIQPTPNSPMRREFASLFFRTLYACGLRLSEARRLTMEQVDLEHGVLTILDGKNQTDRYVPLSPELMERYTAYVKKRFMNANAEQIFFAAPDGGVYSKAALTHLWNQVRKKAQIPKNDDGPRLHDFRHTFAVSCLKRWVREQKDLNAMLPVLSSYMGHKNLGATQRYLRLTAEVFPEVTSMVESWFGGNIPKGNGVDDEE